MTRSSVALGAALLLAACGGSDSSTDTSAVDADAAATTVVETTVPETTVPETTTTEAVVEAEDAMDEDGTASDPAEDVTDASSDADASDPESSIDDSEAAAMLGFMMAAFGVEDPEAVGQCVLDRLDSEGYALDMEGDGGREMVALVGCEPNALRGLYDAGLVEGGTDLDEAQVDCAIDALGTFIGGVPLAEADAILDADLPPEEFMSSVTTDCGISRDALESFLNG